MKSENEVQAPALGGGAARALSCEVVTSFADAAPHRQAWDRLVLETHSDIYMTPEWCRVWWEHYGRGRSLRLFVLRSGEELVGVLPVLIERVWLGPVWVTMAKLVGSDFTPAFCDPPVRAAHAETVFAEVLARLAGECDLVHIGPLSGTYAHFDALRSAALGCDRCLEIVKDSSPGTHTMFTLPESFEAYVQSLSKNQRGSYRRNRNLLEKTFKVHNDLVRGGPELDSEFTRFLVMHAEQWRAEGMLGHFGDWPQAEAFHRDLIRSHETLDRVRLVRLMADDQVLSYQLCFRFGDCCYWRLPARISGDEWHRFALGRVGLTQLFELMIAEGVRRVEAGVGHYDYKTQLGGTEHSLRSLVLIARRRGVRMRARLFLSLARLLHLLYYRIWFLRVAPKLPLPRRPLWRSWIRTRL